MKPVDFENNRIYETSSIFYNAFYCNGCSANECAGTNFPQR